MQRIDTTSHIARGLDALCGIDPRLEAVRAAAGDVPLRRTAPGFASLASIIVSQQVSRASADAIMGRLVTLVDPLAPAALLGCGDDVFRAAGLSRPKQAALLAVAEATHDGTLDLDGLCELDGEEAIARMVLVKGIGPWTAEVYLLTSAGHPDMFPAGDVALQAAVGHGLGIGRPDARTLRLLAESWSPWRSVAARLFWAYYREMRGREAAPAA